MMFKPITPAQREQIKYLHEQIKGGDTAAAIVSIRKVAEVGGLNLEMDGNTAMHLIAETGNIELARLAVPKSDLTKINSKGLTPLHIAAKKNDVPMVTLLVENQANVLAPSSALLETPLHLAAENLSRAAMGVLVAAVPKNTDLNTVLDFEKNNLLHAVADARMDTVEKRHKQMDFFHYLVEDLKLDPTKTNGRGRTPEELALGNIKGISRWDTSVSVEAYRSELNEALRSTTESKPTFGR
jgi:hypothetical protein